MRTETVNGMGVAAGEIGLPDWRIELQPGPLFAWTDQNGKYRFDNLEPGTYTVCEEVKDGYVQTYPTTVCHFNIGLQAGDRLIADFGNADTCWDTTSSYSLDGDKDDVAVPGPASSTRTALYPWMMN